MYRIVACDLDETLISMDHRISEKNIEAITLCRQLGVLFVPASGRGYTSIERNLETIGMQQMAGQYTISFNGAAITENAGHRLLYFNGLDFEKASQIFKFGISDPQLCVQVYTRDKVMTHNYTDAEKGFLQGKMEITEFFDDNIDFLKDEPIAKILFMYPGYEYLNSVESRMGDILDDLDVSYSSGRYLEFNKKGVNKGEGLKHLAEILNVDIRETMAIGDNVNDLPMLRQAGLAVGVANSFAGIRDYCDYITEGDCDHDGVAEALHRFILDR